jgi:vacuolar-type H+-ATPase subunit F/Vma7
MKPLEIIEDIKAIIRGQAGPLKEIPFSFFEEKRETILKVLPFIHPSVSNLDSITINGYYDTAVREFKSVHLVDISPSSALTKEGFETWLTPEREKALPKNYINRYLTWMRKQGRSELVLKELETSSESILGKLGDPQSAEAFDIHGLVVGSVQSGKTGNFNAVINRAVDAGYNLIIILSGIIEDLRSQTQMRLEKDVIGEGIINIDSGKIGPVGVGLVNRFGGQSPNKDVPQVISITSHNSDFNKGVQDTNFSLNHENILVCKKNPGVLKNLLIWLSDYLDEYTEQHSIPLLIVDDEADNASLNNLGHRGREDASTINGHIRAILELFSRKSYLGYTATPFANVLQDRNEPPEGLWPVTFKRSGETKIKNFKLGKSLFPEDFIELLNSPSNYIGAKQIFETVSDSEIIKIPLVEEVADVRDIFPQKLVESNGSIRPATDDEIENRTTGLRSAGKDDLFPSVLPNSLQDAIRCFILSIAVRLKRRPAMVGSSLYNAHDTMLIHVSRFTNWQNRTRNLVIEEVATIQQRTVELPGSPGSLYAELEKIWNRYYASIVHNIRTYLPDRYNDEFLTPLNFSDISSLIPSALEGIEIKAINSVTRDKLKYTTDATGKGKKYIAIGGNTLSRGFTLEGLAINYFLRDTSYADTLLQMGRWFGYRPGYIDVCKLFTTEDAIEKFDASTRTIEELEILFKRMREGRKKRTPRDFVLRVRTHPGVLEITRPSILRNTITVNWSYQDSLVQTTRFEMNAVRISRAWDGLRSLFGKFEISKKEVNGFFIIDTDINGLFSFLDAENTFYDFSDKLGYMKRFISLCVEKKKLRSWRIAIKTKGDARIVPASDSGLPDKIQLSVRSGPSGPDGKSYNRILHDNFVNNGIFTGSGRSANIVTAGLDMAVCLDDKTIQKANEEFISKKKEELLEKNKTITAEELEIDAKKATKPERIYREKMTEDQGLLVIYLMDLEKVFDIKSDTRYPELAVSRGIDTSIPLVGYAIAFPPIVGEIGGRYVQGDYNIGENDDTAEEYDEPTLKVSDE